jgi:hypothetical protein
MKPPRTFLLTTCGLFVHAIVWTHLDPFLKNIFHFDIHYDFSQKAQFGDIQQRRN